MNYKILTDLSKIKKEKVMLFRGTKSRGDNWDTFIKDSHFESRSKDDIYGKIFTIRGSDIWVHVYDKKTDKLLDKSTWGFKEIDLIEAFQIEYKAGECPCDRGSVYDGEMVRIWLNIQSATEQANFILK